MNSLVSGVRGPIDTELKGRESVIHDHDRDLCVTMGWVDVPDSDWGDFRWSQSQGKFLCVGGQGGLRVDSIVEFSADSENASLTKI